MNNSQPLLPSHGGYRKLKSFQVAQLAYDVTVRFCDRNIDRRSRTHDQMVQAARSGVQNIAEGSQASGTSRKMEMKLTNVARASLEELRLDYEDFLRHRGLLQWDMEDPRRAELIARRPTTVDDVAQWVRWVQGLGEKGLGGQNRSSGPDGPDAQDKTDGPDRQETLNKQSTESTPSIPAPEEIMANGALALITVACSLLSRQISAQAAAFERDGGFTERLYATRQQRRRTA